MNTHSKDNHLRADLSGTEVKVSAYIYIDSSKTENHIGASMVAVENCIEIHIETQRLNITRTVFQAELYGIIMAVEWIQRQSQKIPLLHDKRGLQNSTSNHCQ